MPDFLAVQWLRPPAPPRPRRTSPAGAWVRSLVMSDMDKLFFIFKERERDLFSIDCCPTSPGLIRSNLGSCSVSTLTFRIPLIDPSLPSRENYRPLPLVVSRACGASVQAPSSASGPIWALLPPPSPSGISPLCVFTGVTWPYPATPRVLPPGPGTFFCPGLSTDHPDFDLTVTSYRKAL